MAKSIKKKADAKPIAERKGKAIAKQKSKAPARQKSKLPVPPAQPAPDVLNRLWTVILARKNADPAVSHSARLLARGPAKVAQKFGEEAVECLIEAAAGNVPALVAESADVLYHLMVMWVAIGVAPGEVWAELERREGVSGITEKAERARALSMRRGPGTTKIP